MPAKKLPRGQAKKSIAVRIPEHQLRDVRYRAKIERMTPSEWIRRAVERALRRGV